MMPFDSTNIRLVSCVGVDTEYAHLGHFIDHYLNLGLRPENVHLILNALDADSPNIDRAQAVLASRNIEAEEIWIASYTSASMWSKRREVQARRVPACDWVISADVDELHEYPEPLAPFLARCERRRVNCVQGVLIDRLTTDGALGAIEEDRSIWASFPVQADVQCSVGRVGEHYDLYGTVKAMAFRGDLFPDQGGHGVLETDRAVRYLFGRHLAQFGAIGFAPFRFAIPLRVHHFKWTVSMMDTLRRRLATPGVSPAGAEYGRTLIDYFEQNNGVRMDEVPIRTVPACGHEPWRRRVAYLRSIDAACEFRKRIKRVKRKVAKRFVS